MTPITDAQLSELEEALAEATPGDLTTAQYVDPNGHYECPMCECDGYVDGATYTNFDGLALGVQFFGIGDKHGAHQDLWEKALRHLPALIARIKAAEAENARLREVFGALLPTKLCGESWGCPDAETVSIVVTFGALKAARAALEGQPK